jgi:AraC-like DNA-binding protein
MAAAGALRTGGAGQSYVERRPGPGHAALVSSLWIQRIEPGAAPYRQLNIPTGGAELTCRLGDTPLVRGPSTAPVTDTLPPGTTIIGVRLHPGAAAAIFGLPADALRDEVVDIDVLWGERGRMVADAVNRRSRPDEALAVLHDQLLARALPPGAPDPLVSAAVRQIRDDRSISAVSERLDISERQLRRRCETAVGLAPKTLHRVLRFQRFVALTQRGLATGAPGGRPTVAALAAEVGYADEAHLSRECVRLTGRTPAAFLANAEEQCACGHDHAASYAPQLAAAVRFRSRAGQPAMVSGDDERDALRAVTGPPAFGSSRAAAAGSRPWGR